MAETRSSLIRRVRDPRDAESWREFVELYEPLLLSYVRSRGLAQPDAQDVVQDILASLIGTMPEFELDHGRGRFRTWLWRVTMNALANFFRRRRRQNQGEEEWRECLTSLENESRQGPGAAWESGHHRRVLDFVLSRVRADTQPKTWACFEQHLVQGRASDRIAAELGLTAVAVRVNASRVLARVKEQCQEYMEELGDESSE